MIQQKYSELVASGRLAAHADQLRDSGHRRSLQSDRQEPEFVAPRSSPLEGVRTTSRRSQSMRSYRFARRSFLAGIGGAFALEVLLRSMESAAAGGTSPARMLLTH